MTVAVTRTRLLMALVAVATFFALTSSPFAASLSYSFHRPFLPNPSVPTLHANLNNTMRIWSFNPETHAMAANQQIIITTSAGMFPDGSGRQIMLTTNNRGVAVFSWMLNESIDDGLEVPVRFSAEPFHPSPGSSTLKITQNFTAQNHYPTQPQVDPDSQSIACQFGELCNAPDFDFLDTPCNLGFGNRTYKVWGSVSPKYFWAVPGDVIDLEYHIWIENYECPSCDGCDWIVNPLDDNFDTIQNCPVCHASRQYCSMWKTYEDLLLRGPSIGVTGISVPNAPDGTPMFEVLDNNGEFNVDYYFNPIRTVLVQNIAADIPLIHTVSGFDDNWDAANVAIWYVYMVKWTLWWFGVDISVAQVKNFVKLGIKLATSTNPILVLAKAFGPSVLRAVVWISQNLNLAVQMSNHQYNCGGEPQSLINPDGAHTVLQVLPVMLTPAPYDEIKIKVKLRANVAMEGWQNIDSALHLIVGRNNDGVLVDYVGPVLQSVALPFHQQARVIDPPKCTLGQARCIDDTHREECVWDLYVDYAQIFPDFYWYQWKTLEAPVDTLCRDGHFVPECDESQTRCTRVDGWLAISHCEFGPTDDYPVDHWHWVDEPVEANTTCRDGELIPLDLPDCPNNITITSAGSKVLDWCPLPKSPWTADEDYIGSICDDRGNVYECRGGNLYCQNCRAYAELFGNDSTDCGWSDNWRGYTCVPAGSALDDPLGRYPRLAIQCTPPCEAGQRCRAITGGSSECVSYCKPDCVREHSGWPNNRPGKFKECGSDGCSGSCGNGCTSGQCIDGVCSSCRRGTDLLCGDPAVGAVGDASTGVCSCADNCGLFGELPCCPGLCQDCPNTMVRLNPAYGIADFNMCQCQPQSECQQQDEFGIKCGAGSDGCGGYCSHCPSGTACMRSEQAAQAHRDPWRCLCVPSAWNTDFMDRPWNEYGRYKYRDCDAGCGILFDCPGTNEPCVTVQREWDGVVHTAIGICAGTVNCEGKECGTNGYGWPCGGLGADGHCPLNQECIDGHCVCTPSCVGPTGNQHLCGSDGCSGSCGTCPPQHECRFDETGQRNECVCVADCEGKECGPDGCGGSCGTCNPSYPNTQCLNGTCFCTPDCNGKQCGPDGCGGNCGFCAQDQACSGAGLCEQANTGCLAWNQSGCDGCGCESEVCAMDADCCGANGGVWDDLCVSLCSSSTAGCISQYCDNGVGSCDTGIGENCDNCPSDCPCATGQVCSFDGECCTPDCDGKQCGPDGCGGYCGSCNTGEVCDQGRCAASETCEGYCPAWDGQEWVDGPAGACGCGTACATVQDCCNGVCECGTNATMVLHLDEPSVVDNTNVEDNSRAHQDAVLHAQDSNQRSISDGKFSRAIHLQEADYIQAPSALLSPTVSSADLTVSLWVRMTDVADKTIIQQDSGGTSSSFSLQTASDGTVMYQKGGVVIASSSSQLSPGAWTQIAFSRADNGTVTLYLNGAATGSTGSDMDVFDDTPTLFGGWSGDLDDVAVYDGLLSSSYILRLFQQHAHIYYGYVSFCDPECVPDCSSYGYDDFGHVYTTGPDGCGGWCPCPEGSTPWEQYTHHFVCSVSSCSQACSLPGVIQRGPNPCQCDAQCAGFGGEQTLSCCEDLCDVCPNGPYCPFVTSCDGKECGTVINGAGMPPDYCGSIDGGCSDTNKVCMSDGTCCLPDCATSECGDDGCGGSCGQCPGAQDICNSGVCVCQPDCSGKQCGSDGCSGQCGTCAGQDACENGTCVCQPDCAGKNCGDDGCGGSCGVCSTGDTCQNNVCVCIPECDGKQCGDDGCGGSCGTCQGSQEICTAAQCVCQPDCSSKQCGDDGCGGSCGTCQDTHEICSAGQCQCSPDCGGKQCGPDGCGGSCGSCEAGQDCVEENGACLPSSTSDGDTQSAAGGCGGCPCEACVCDMQPDCCSVAWDDSCVELCSSHCGGSSNFDCGDNSCEFNAGENCENCSADCRCDSGETCHQGQCKQCGCEDRQCGLDPCGEDCGQCPDGIVCDSMGRCLLDPTGGGCSESDTAGCHGCACESCVCDIMPACCTDVWNSQCSLLCRDECFACGQSCGECDGGDVCDSGICRPPSCADSCGGQSTEGKCWCDAGCMDRGDCCSDVCEQCSEQITDCPQNCGDGDCNAQQGEDCLSCAVDCACEQGFVCNPDGDCCEPQCDGKQCGPDGCGGDCGTCQGSAAHCENGQCECDASCDGKQCGPDGCGGSCGECPDGKLCFDNRCGELNSCLGFCGQRAPGGCLCDEHCDEAGTQCCPDICDACGDLIRCGSCGDGECDTQNGENCSSCPQDCPLSGNEVCLSGKVCTPDCENSVCGSDGCGGSCGQCDQTQQCAIDHCESGQGCEASDDPGNPGGKCEMCVCKAMPDCCANRWTEACAFVCAASCGGCGPLEHCGDGNCQEQDGEYCGNCPSDCSCDGECQNFSCCTRDCEGKNCGPDGCGGTCGECDGLCLDGICHQGMGCEASPTGGCSGCACETCVCEKYPQCCSQRWAPGCVFVCNNECGGCGALESCGDGSCDPAAFETCRSCPADCACEASEVCGDKGFCCLPDCEDKSCGPDGCGGTCGECDGLCIQGVCMQGEGCQAHDKAGCNGCACEACVEFSDPYCSTVVWDSFCAETCATDCGGCGVLENCGDNQCNESEGENCSNCPEDCSCEDGWSCAGGDCCVPDCLDAQCGPDGCGGQCGDCGQDGVCFAGTCYNGPGSTADDEPGCGGCACEACVCQQHPLCCDDRWSDDCVSFCITQCGGPGMLDNCGDGVCDGIENCINCADDCGCRDGSACTTVGCVPDYCDDGLGQTGCCMGDILVACDAEGRIAVSNCGWSGLECGWYSEDGTDTGAYYCANAPMLNTSGDPSGVYPMDCSEYCTPDCEGRQCGDDGCGGSCGTCPRGNQCVENDVCMDGKCQAGQPVTCDSDKPCMEPYCDTSSGCLVRPRDDGSFCNPDSEPKARCRNGVCTALAPGDLCETALKLMPDEPVEIDLARMFNDATPDKNCLDLGNSGPDAFFMVEIKKGSDYYFHLDGSGKIWLENDCDSSCLASSESGHEHDQVLIHSADKDGTMILVVDSEEGQNKGSLMLGMSVVSPVQDGGDADGGSATNTGDGCGCSQNATGTPWLLRLLLLAGLLSLRFLPTRASSKKK